MSVWNKYKFEIPIERRESNLVKLSGSSTGSASSTLISATVSANTSSTVLTLAPTASCPVSTELNATTTSTSTFASTDCADSEHLSTGNVIPGKRFVSISNSTGNFLNRGSDNDKDNNSNSNPKKRKYSVSCMMQRSGCSNNFFENNPSSAGTSVITSNSSLILASESEKGIGAAMGTMGSANGERIPNFSKLDVNAHLREHRSSTTTSGYFNKMTNTIGGVTGCGNASNKPGDVKKIVIKNFKGNKLYFLSFIYEGFL